GPVDVIAPRVIAAAPPDSAVRLPVDSPVEITFSETMDRTTVRDGFRIYPPVGRQTFDWSGRRVRVVWDRPLSERTTYIVLLSGTIRDARSVPMRNAVTLHFSTGDSLDRGRISGVLRAKTLRRAGAERSSRPTPPRASVSRRSRRRTRRSSGGWSALARARTRSGYRRGRTGCRRRGCPRPKTRSRDPRSGATSRSRRSPRRSTVRSNSISAPYLPGSGPRLLPSNED